MTAIMGIYQGRVLHGPHLQDVDFGSTILAALSEHQMQGPYSN